MAFLPLHLFAQRLPMRPVAGTSWKGHHVVTRAHAGIPHRFDRLTYVWAATHAAHAGPDASLAFDLREVRDGFGRRGSLEDAARSLDRVAHSVIEARPPEVERVTELAVLTPFERFRLCRRSGRGRLRFGSLFRRGDLIPVEANVLQTLAGTSLRTLDQYLWQVTAAHRHRENLPLAIPLDQVLTELACPIQDPAAARYRLRKRQRMIAETSSCPREILEDVFVLHGPTFFAPSLCEGSTGVFV